MFAMIFNKLFERKKNIALLVDPDKVDIDSIKLLSEPDIKKQTLGSLRWWKFSF
jgi:hypothetical protein